MTHSATDSALLPPSSPHLAHEPDALHAARLLDRFRPHSEEQRATRDRMLAFIAEHPEDAHRRTCVPGHLTASALLLNHSGTRALLTHHRKLDRWLQLGGHCDGDANLAAVALRECIEESGIPELRIDPTPVDLDIHPIPARPGEPEHLHLDTRFLVHAPEGAVPELSDESHELAWFGPEQLDGLDLDTSVLRLYQLAFRGQRVSGQATSPPAR